MNKALIGIGVLALIIGVYFWSTYNKLVTLDEQITGQWAQVENQYQRRFDLIPNLVESVKGVMNQEQEVFGQIAEARTRYAGAPSGSDEQVEAAGEMEGALARLLVIMENYPVLQSSQNVQSLQSQLEGTENRVSAERTRYNESVQMYNATIKRFPAKMIAGWFGFEARTYFKAVEGGQEAPKVEF